MMNVFQRGIRSIFRKPVKSILLLIVVVVISSFFMAGLAGQSANIKTQDATRQAVGATFRLEVNEMNSQKRGEEASKILGNKEGEYNGYVQKQMPDGAWLSTGDNSFYTIRQADVQKIAEVDGIEAYNLITVSTPVNPVNFKRIENPDVDQSSDLGGVNVRGNRIMEMDMDVASGKIKLVEGRMIKENETDV
ncbi:ABC transporter permease, partial [[Clostridium] scindens]|nr:ABC transporter permease [[Clostridium] scindens]